MWYRCDMSWDYRGAKAYFYQNVREGNKVRKVYIGRGEKAEEMAHQVEQRQKERQAQRELCQREMAELAAAEEKLRELRAIADLLVRAVLLGANCYQHKGQWRRRRNGKDGHQQQDS